MREPSTTFAIALASAALVGSAPGARAAAGWELAKVALQGESAPGTSGTFEAFDVSRESGTAVLFVATLSGSPPSWVLYRSAGGSLAPLALPGASAPGTGGGVYQAPLSLPSGGAGDYSFAALLGGGTASLGLFADTGPGVAPVFLEGDAAPGGGSFAPLAGELTLHDRNAAGTVVFSSSLSGAPAAKGLFVASAGPIAALESEGGAAPGGGTWTDLRHPCIDDTGRVAFVGSVSGGAAPTGLFVREGATTTALALVGDAAPGTGGGSFDAFHYPRPGAGGAVVFLAGATGGSATGGVFRASTAGVEALLVENDPIPDTGGGVITTFNTLPTRSPDSSLAFSGSLSGGAVGGGVFVREDDGAIRSVVVAGDPAPDAGGATFTGFGFVGRDAEGALAFQADLSDGRSGLFSAAPGSAVPLLPDAGLALLTALLALMALAALRRPARARERAPELPWRPPRPS